jgi:NADH dehydrogenase
LAAGDFPDHGFDVVTGAFSYSGAAIARELERSGRRVRTLTGHPERARAGSGIEVRPLDFDDLMGLTASLEGATALYNTYWVRFPHGEDDYDRAVANSQTLFHAALDAGIERIVHVSITHPSVSSPYGYFRGKARVERALAEIGVSYAVLRPAILFGGDGVLLNNIAWLLRHLPVFGVGGNGEYRIRAVHIDDLASLAVAAGAERTDTVTDAVGPERPTFLELVRLIRSAVGSRSLIVRVPGVVVPPLANLLGLVLRDVLLTGDEYRAMADGLADTDGPATGTIAVSEWIEANADSLGRTYANELDRHFRRHRG